MGEGMKRAIAAAKATRAKPKKVAPVVVIEGSWSDPEMELNKRTYLPGIVIKATCPKSVPSASTNAWGAVATARATHLRRDGHGDAAAVLDSYVTELDADLDSEDAREEPGMVAEMLRVIA